MFSKNKPKIGFGDFDDEDLEGGPPKQPSPKNKLSPKQRIEPANTRMVEGQRVNVGATNSLDFTSGPSSSVGYGHDGYPVDYAEPEPDTPEPIQHSPPPADYAPSPPAGPTHLPAAEAEVVPMQLPRPKPRAPPPRKPAPPPPRQPNAGELQMQKLIDAEEKRRTAEAEGMARTAEATKKRMDQERVMVENLRKQQIVEAQRLKQQNLEHEQTRVRHEQGALDRQRAEMQALERQAMELAQIKATEEAALHTAREDAMTLMERQQQQVPYLITCYSLILLL